jgi:starch phosphorylase
MGNDGTNDRDQAVAALAGRLPGPLAPLADLAYNYWWSWTPGGDDLFASVDADAWELARHNPIRLLQDAPARSLEKAAADEAFIAHVQAFHGRFRAELDAADAHDAVPSDSPVAFFCMEFGIHPSLPIFSGGLGVLSGDLLKEASDRRVPFIGIGLLYHQGYTHQRLDTSGWQHEYWLPSFPHRLPAVMVTSEGRPLTVSVRIRDHDVEARIWRVDLGRTRLYLLDTQRASDPIDRWITSRLYIEDPTVRLAQYALVGVGGMRALRAMGFEPGIVHLNEGHAIFAAAELMRSDVAAGRSADEAFAATRSRTIFTTHTPVAAGNESHPSDDIRKVVSEIDANLGPLAQRVLALGRSDGDRFGLTEFGLRTARFANGVSEMHGEVARKMWDHLTDDGADVKISHVTNGVHIGTWMARPMRDLLDRHLPDRWIERADDPEVWNAIDTIGDGELWDVRNRLRAELVEFAKNQAVTDRLARGESIEYVETARRAFDPALLTIGFARRATAYKRLYLLTLDPQRALGLIQSKHPIQVLLAGKAHPADEEAKHIVRRLFELKRMPEVGARVAYLEDYDLRIASRLVAGCDVWLNVPRPPLEASGTSGMKAAMNGGLNLSVLDGWWAEAFDGTNGWGIESDDAGGPEEQDARDAKELYDVLENEVIPLFNDRDETGVPRGWISKIKASLKTNGPRFSARRMLNDYLASAYRTD